MNRAATEFARSASIAAEVLFHARWSVDALCAMRSGPARFGQLVRMLPGASKKGLTKALRDLENSGIVTRRDLSDTVLHIEYELTWDKKARILDLLDHLADLGNTYIEDRRIVSADG